MKAIQIKRFGSTAEFYETEVDTPEIKSGQVSAHDVTNCKKGDEVYGCIGGYLSLQGALADYVAVDHRLIALKPKTLSIRQAASLPLVAETAWEGLFNKARLQPKQKVLIYGGTGGVGHIAALFAKAAGANVTVTASSIEKSDIIANQLGIANIFNYKKSVY